MFAAATPAERGVLAEELAAVLGAYFAHLDLRAPTPTAPYSIGSRSWSAKKNAPARPAARRRGFAA
jgi:hypothetical protein